MSLPYHEGPIVTLNKVFALAEHYTSQIALVVDGQPDVGVVVGAAIQAGDIDRSRAIGVAAEAAEVHWGGRMAKAVVRRIGDGDDHLLRSEAAIGSDGLELGLQRQAQLLQGLARQLRGRVLGVRDLSARTDRDLAWINRLAIGAVHPDDAIVAVSRGEGTHWVATHGAARLDVPDLEFYGLLRGQVDGAIQAAGHLHAQLLDKGLKRAELTLPDGTEVYLVPVLEAWQMLPLDWPGIGRAGVTRGAGLDGPRATVSLLTRPRFGRYKTDIKGVTAHL